MKLKLFRYGQETNHSTGGALSIDDVFHCHTVEDEYRKHKVCGETRISAGTYTINLRTEGGMAQRYNARYPWHKGMLWLRDVPNFKWVYLHIGNNEKQTDGCILVGYTAYSLNGFSVGRSVDAYRSLWYKVFNAIQQGEEVTIEIIDGDR